MSRVSEKISNQSELEPDAIASKTLQHDTVPMVKECLTSIASYIEGRIMDSAGNKPLKIAKIIVRKKKPEVSERDMIFIENCCLIGAVYVRNHKLWETKQLAEIGYYVPTYQSGGQN